MNKIDIESDPVHLARKWFIFFCSMHFIIWFLLPTLIYQNPPTDSLEGIAWGNLWLWGYAKHPFLAPWLTALVTNIFSVVGWPIYLLSQISVITCFWSIWRLANHILSPWYALISVVLLEGINYYNLQSAIFDPNVLMLPLWALTTLTFYNAAQQNKRLPWVWVGVFAGLSLDCKYESGLLLVILFICLLITKEGQNSFKNPGLYCGLLIAFLIFLPNLYWLYQHHFNAVHYAVAEMANEKIKNIPSVLQPFYKAIVFIGQQMGNAILILLLYLPFYQGRNKHLKINSFDWKFLLLLGAGPLILTVLLCIITNANLVARWGFPFFSVSGILLVAWYKPIINELRLKQFAILVIITNFLLVLGAVIYFLILPFITGKAQHSDTFPGQNIAIYVTKKWQDYYHSPLMYVAGMHHVVVNVASFSIDKPIAYFDWNPKESPWINEKDLQKRGAVFVYWVNDLNALSLIKKQFPQLQHVSKKVLKNHFHALQESSLALIRQRFPNLEHISIHTFKRLTRAQVKPVQIWIAFLPPQKLS